MNKTYAPHITSLLAGAGAVIALVHPGFTVPVVTQTVVISLCSVVAGALQFFHAASHRSISANVQAAIAYAEHVAKSTPAETPAP